MKKLIFMLSALLILTSCATTKDLEGIDKTPLKDDIKEVVKDGKDEEDKVDLEDKDGSADKDDVKELEKDKVKGKEEVKDKDEAKDKDSNKDKDKPTASKPSKSKPSTTKPAPAKPTPATPSKPTPSKPAPKPAEPVITWEEEVSYNIVNFSTENINDNSLNKGDNKVKRNGVTGQDKVIVSIKFSDGKEVARSQKTVRTIEPINQIMLIGTYVEPTKPPQQSGVVTSGGQVQVMVDLINKDRSSRGLNKLSISGELSRAAGVRAEEITRSFSHTRPDGQPFYSVSNDAYGENISYGYSSGASGHEGFMNSQGHKDNILNDRWGTVGIGMFVSSDGTTYWAVLFG